MYRVPYTGVSMSVALVRLHVLIKIFIGPYLRVTLSIHDIDFRAGLVADPSMNHRCQPPPRAGTRPTQISGNPVPRLGRKQ